MKTIVPILLSLGLALAAQADPAQQAYQKGMAAMQAGEIDQARAAFEQALRLRPDHAYAKFRLGQLDANREAMTEKRRAAQLASIRLAKIDFDELPFSEALDGLSLLVEAAQEGEDKFSPNFILQDPDGKLGAAKVSLSLKNIPAKAAFDYLLQQAGATARYDEHAIAVRPAAKSGTP